MRKLQRIALLLLLALVGIAFASGAHADRYAVLASSGNSTTADSPPVNPPGTGATDYGDPDQPSHQGRLGVSNPSDLSVPTRGHARSWLGHGTVWLRVYLSRWFAR